MALRVVFSPEAATDLIKLYEYIAERSGPLRAIAYIDRIEAYCAGFESSPERGTGRDDLRPGLRIVGFERRVTIAFRATPSTVIIDRILYAGRDVQRALSRRLAARVMFIAAPPERDRPSHTRRDGNNRRRNGCIPACLWCKTRRSARARR